ncbi:hypothetical protein F2Q68_00008274 [Brassica cretica]|uniref:Uncharacterized protein n=1 Tax=Brassica cretica TaxID=69181 RepID=A0A8S9L4G5_BRACR|nr:hypothetical protein F2Q68_00008274 [Brassica cretica]
MVLHHLLAEDAMTTMSLVSKVILLKLMLCVSDGSDSALFMAFDGGDNNPIDDIPGVGSVKTKASNGVTNAPILE